MTAPESRPNAKAGLRGPNAKESVSKAVHRVEAVVDPVLDQVEKQLPVQARIVMHTARTAGKVVQETLLR